MRSFVPAVLALATALVTACSGDSTTVASATATSIVVRADALVAGRGCGKGADQIFKYVATVDPPSDSTQVPLSEIYDCFADATFVGLAPSATNRPFGLHIHGFNAADFTKNEGAIRAAVAQVASNETGALTSLNGLATWRTDCSATQQTSVTVLAICPDPLR
jgi:hypothetical protein